MAFPIETSSAEVLAKEAEKRGMHVERLHHIRSGYIVVTSKKHRKVLFQSQSNKLGRVTARILSHKALTSHFLRKAGFPIPDDILAKTPEEAISFVEKHPAIVVKPLNSTGGKGISIDVTTPEQAQTAFETAQSHNDLEEKGAICQQQVDGKDYRILVVDKKHVFTVERVPAHVIGDGKHTVKQLIEQHNETAKSGYEIPIERIIPTTLSREGISFDTVPEKDAHVRVMRAANSHIGGQVVNADDAIADSVKDIARAIAQHFDCPVLGVDCMSEDINTSIGHIIELNEAPALYKHENPDKGKGQPVGAAIIDMLFGKDA